MSKGWAALAAFTSLLLVGCGAERPDGAALYREHCAICHQEKGGGVPFMNAPLVGSAVVEGDPETLARWVLLGNDAADAGYASDYTNLMPGFAQLKDDEIAAMLTYIRREFAQGASPVAPEIVAGAR